MSREESIKILKQIAQTTDVSNSVLENSLWVLENLKDKNQPNKISTNSNKNILLNFEEDIAIEITRNSVYYLQYTWNGKGDSFKRFLFTPKGELGARDMFFLNAEIEYEREIC